MSDYYTGNPIALIEGRFGIHLKKVTTHEWAGPCPFCGGDDRWHYWDDKHNWWCRPGPGHCGKKGFLDELFDEFKRPSKEQLLEWRIQRLEAKQREHERRISALERMAECTDHLRYHEGMDLDQMAYWLDEGITVDTIARYQLGWCPRCPTDRDGRPSYTIPVYGRDGQTLINIRHRLYPAVQGDKYRPHIAGLGAQLFNARFTAEPGQRIVIVEGEKKSIVLDQEGIPNVAVMGKRSFKKEWLCWLAPFREVYVALDPDVKESAVRLARMFGDRGRIVDLHVKPDDFFTRYGGTKYDFENFLGVARPAPTD